MRNGQDPVAGNCGVDIQEHTIHIDRNFSESDADFRGGPPIIPARNVVGQPALAIPNGFGPNNLPTAIQFTGKIWSEVRLHAYRRATDWHRRRPNLKMC